MGIIKKNQVYSTPSQREGRPAIPDSDSAHSQREEFSEDTPTVSVKPAAPPVPWTPENVEQGLVKERRNRDEPVTSDRRRGYRRIEDRTLISKAHEEAKAIKEKAYDDGYRDGMHAVQGDVEILRGIFQQLMLSRNTALESLTDDLAPIAVEIAERIIKTEISCDEELVNTIVQDTLQKLDRKTRTVLIKVNPDDVATVKQFIKENPPTHLDAEMVVIDDPIVDRGGCTVETNSGLIDASFGTRLEILKQLFGAYHVPDDDESDALLHMYHEAVDPPSSPPASVSSASPPHQPLPEEKLVDAIDQAQPVAPEKATGIHTVYHDDDVDEAGDAAMEDWLSDGDSGQTP